MTEPKGLVIRCNNYVDYIVVPKQYHGGGVNHGRSAVEKERESEADILESTVV